MSQETVSVLFVCMGNICRSPAAEGVFRSLAKEAGLQHRIRMDSAGTIGYHAGQLADSRMRLSAEKRGYVLSSRARQIMPADLDEFDLILTMDEENHQHVLILADSQAQRDRVKPFCDFCADHNNRSVPDPYYGGADGFETVLDLLEDGCRGVLAEAEMRLT
ncbi:MAG: low molecular weight protein-tyrosine-phosphatase [Verrucomicrobiota bacterium]